MKTLLLAIFISSLVAYNETSYDEAHTTATINLSDEFPPAFPSSATSELIVRTVQTDQHSRGQHGIYYLETFPNVEKILFWKGSLENIDFESLAELPSLREIIFNHVYLISPKQAQLFAPLQHKKNLTLIFYSEVLERPKIIQALQEVLPNAKLDFQVWHDLMY